MNHNAPKFTTPIGDIVKAVRTKTNLTKTALAEITGLSRSYIRDIENNVVSPPVDVLHELVWACGNHGISLDIYTQQEYEDRQATPGEARLIKALRAKQYDVVFMELSILAMFNEHEK